MSDLDKVILTDVDGVLLNWEYAFDRWVTKHGYTINPDVTAYDICERYGIPTDKKLALICAFNESAHMAFVPPFRDAIKYVRKLHEEHGYIFHVITSMTLDPYAQDLRKINLRKVFGETIFERFEFTDTGGNKDEILSKYKDTGYFWIEDKWPNAILGTELGLNSVIMNHLHNKDEMHPDIMRVNNWKEIYNLIT